MPRLPDVQLRQAGNACAMDQPHCASDRCTISCVPDGADLRVVMEADTGRSAGATQVREKNRVGASHRVLVRT